MKPPPHLERLTPASALLGREMLWYDPDAGEIRGRFVARPEFANRHGTVQGGFLAAMLDSVCGNVVMAGLPTDRTVVTVRLDVRYLKPAALGEMRASARIAARDERSVAVDGELADHTGTVVATARAEFRIVVRGGRSAPAGDQSSRA